MLRVLTLLGEAPEPVGVQHLAQQAGLPMSTVHRIVNAFVEDGYAIYDPDRRLYSAGPQLMRLAGLGEGNGPATVLRGYLQALSERYDETLIFNLYLPDKRAIAAVLTCEGTRPLRYSFARNQPVSLAFGASGKSVLAYLGEDIIRAAWEETLEVAPERAVSYEEYVAQMAAIRDRGWAASDGERIPGARAVGAVVRSYSGRVVGGICITYPRERTPAPTEELGAVMAATARDVSKMLGDNL